MNPQRKTTRMVAAIEMYSNVSPLAGEEGESGVGVGVGGVTTG